MDSLQQIIKDQKCRNDAEISEANYKLSLANARDSINNRLKNTEKNIKANLDDNSKKISGKIDSNKLKPAYITGINEPHNVFTINETGGERDFDFKVENEGDLPAYSVETSMYLLLRKGNHLYKLCEGKNAQGNLSALAIRPLGFTTDTSKYEYYSFDEAYFIAIGKYYLDDEHKTVRQFQAVSARYIKSNEPTSYDLTISPQEAINIAEKIK